MKPRMNKLRSNNLMLIHTHHTRATAVKLILHGNICMSNNISFTINICISNNVPDMEIVVSFSWLSSLLEATPKPQFLRLISKFSF